VQLPSFIAAIALSAVAEIGRDAKMGEIVWKIAPLPVCHGDYSVLRLVIVNLLSSVVKFTRIRKLAEIEIDRTKHNTGEMDVFVRDDGAGFDMLYANKLFGVFQRLHLSDEFEGTGIGLASVQPIIHRHGGNVKGESAVDKDATFYFSLPRTPDSVEGL
jgi:light-regulated signal transduction histidine kinase (bacteriophytochrome)